jgi:hypothetical protein
LQNSIFSEKALTDKDKLGKYNKDNRTHVNPERYTIFHALFEALKEKDKNHKKK